MGHILDQAPAMLGTPCLIFSLALAAGSECPDDQSPTFPDGSPCNPGPPYNGEDPANCAMYYLCYKGCVSHKMCDENWLFDTDKKSCELPDQVDCKDRPCEDPDRCPAHSTTTTTTTHVPTTTPPEITTTTPVPTTTTPEI